MGEAMNDKEMVDKILAKINDEDKLESRERNEKKNDIRAHIKEYQENTKREQIILLQKEKEQEDRKRKEEEEKKCYRLKLKDETMIQNLEQIQAKKQQWLKLEEEEKELVSKMLEKFGLDDEDERIKQQHENIAKMKF